MRSFPHTGGVPSSSEHHTIQDTSNEVIHDSTTTTADHSTTTNADSSSITITTSSSTGPSVGPANDGSWRGDSFETFEFLGETTMMVVMVMMS